MFDYTTADKVPIVDYDALVESRLMNESRDTIPAPPSFTVEGELEGEPVPTESDLAPLQEPEEVIDSMDQVEANDAGSVVPPTFYLYKRNRYALICEGVCTNCAHCGIALTDAVSVERGMGPSCSKRGYHEDPVQSDEMQAFIDLAEFPELCSYLTAKYKPLGVRELMNGLVKIASLNRKSPGLHSAICDAIQSLGYKRLSSTLRESISVIEIRDSKSDPNSYNVWVKKSEFNWQWSKDLKEMMGISYYGRLPIGDKGVLIPKKYKRQLWEIMLKHYSGFSAKTPSGAIKIEPKVISE